MRSAPITTCVLVSLLAIACRDGGAAEPKIVAPAAPVTDLGAAETAALAAERDLARLLTAPLAARDLSAARAGLVSSNFRGVPPGLGSATTAGPLDVIWLSPEPRAKSASPRSSSLRAEAFLQAIDALSGLDQVERVEVEILRFELDPAGDLATALLRQRWAGHHPLPKGEGHARRDLTLYGEVELRAEDGQWKLAQFEPAVDHRHTHGAGLRLSAAEPRYVDRTDSVGLSLGTSVENRDLIQSFIDRHLTLALGGLTVTDFNGDGRPDLLATRAEETTLVFLNDGASGFRPTPFPIERLSDRPAFVLAIDLDGDGLDELVGTEVSRFQGDTAFAGLWTRTPADGEAAGAADARGPWRHLPQAFSLPNPVGMRRLAVQNAIPFDADGDGDLDLFFAVYGNAESRGDHYNTVEAHDGADNYLLMNQGDLRFTEESEARGITGTDYSYVALGFDADHDGDVDLFEGNDFGPNVLWRNDGGVFVDDTAAGLGGVSAYTMGAALADLEADGTWDLYVSNMSSEEGMRMVPLAQDLSETMRGRVDTIARGNMFYREPGADTGPRWTEHAETLGLHEGEWAWGCQFVDIDGNGEEEILVTNGFASHANPNLGDWQTYYWRQVIDDGARLESGERSRDVNRSLRFQGSFNGHERDRLYLRVSGTDPNRPWVDGGYCLGFDGSYDGRALVPIDPDGDGDLDLALLTLQGLVYLENVSPSKPWVRVRLLEEDGGPALGARIYFNAQGRRSARHVGLVEGFQSQIPTDLTLALADGAASLAELEIQWADGEVRRVKDLPAGRLVTIQRGEESPRTAAVPTWPSGSLAVDPKWRKLLRQMRPRKDGPQAVPIRFGGKGAAPSATAVLDSDGRPLRWFEGDAAQADVEPFLAIGAQERALPHLLIQSGRIALDEARYREALLTFQRAVKDRNDLAAADAPAFEGIARAHVLLGRIDRAEAAYRRSVELDPDYAVGYFNLAASYAHQGRFDEAVQALQQTERIEGPTARVIGSMVENAGSAGNLALARRYGDLWMEANPKDGRMLTLLGKVHARARALEEAKGLFERALTLDPRDQEAKEALALTMRLLGGDGR